MLTIATRNGDTLCIHLGSWFWQCALPQSLSLGRLSKAPECLLGKGNDA